MFYHEKRAHFEAEKSVFCRKKGGHFQTGEQGWVLLFPVSEGAGTGKCADVSNALVYGLLVGPVEATVLEVTLVITACFNWLSLAVSENHKWENQTKLQENMSVTVLLLSQIQNDTSSQHHIHNKIMSFQLIN